MLQLPEHGWAAPAAEVCQHRHHHPLLLGQPCRQGGVESLNNYLTVFLRTVVPHSFFADPDPYVFLNEDLDPSGSGSSFKNFVKIAITLWRVCCSWKNKKRYLKSKKKPWSWSKLTLKVLIKLQLSPIFLHYFCVFSSIFPSWFHADPDPQPWFFEDPSNNKNSGFCFMCKN